MPCLEEPKFFPSPRAADSQGLVGFGGELSSEWLLDAYRHGIFPWPIQENLLAWWSPDPRAILEFKNFHLPRRLLRQLRSDRFQVTIDQDFSAVIHGCATAQGRLLNTWITPEIQSAYIELHRLGIAHSIEVRREGELVGGLYGVALGGMFAAESMFHFVSEASKVALARLVHHLQQRGFELLDIQQLTPHTERFGAGLIPRETFLTRLTASLKSTVEFGQTLEPLLIR